MLFKLFNLNVAFTDDRIPLTAWTTKKKGMLSEFERIC